MTTEQKLEQRVAALEHQLAQLKAGSAQKPMSESRGLRLIRQAEESHADLLAASQKLMQTIGIQGQAIGAKKLRKMLLAQGINPDENAFSREIIAMREE
jgi:bacterioferritin (cytochrome b1)